jgi:hypothetical protein
MSLLDDSTVIPTLEALAQRCPAEREALLAAIGALRPQQPLPGIDAMASLPGPSADELVDIGRGARLFIQHAASPGEPAVPNELVMRGAVTYGQLVRRGMLPAIADPMRRSHAVALIAGNFSDNPPSTPQRVALFAAKLDEVGYG